MSLTGSVPEDGAVDVPVDLALAIEVQGYGGPFMDPNVSLVDAVTGLKVEGEVTQVYWDRMLARFEPNAPLEPNHKYVLQAEVTPEAERPNDAMGVELLQATFTTGEAALPALTAVGSLEVTLEPVEREDYSKCDPGLCECTPTGTLADTQARLKLPGALGGDASRGYRVLVMVTRDEPYDFADLAMPGSAHVYANSATFVQHEAGMDTAVGLLRSSDGEYQPCFSAQIRDFSGNTITVDPVCLNEAIPRQAQPDAEDVDAGASDVTDMDPDAASDVGVDKVAADSEPPGCSLGQAPRGQCAQAWLWSCLGLAVALPFRRRLRFTPRQSCRGFTQ